MDNEMRSSEEQLPLPLDPPSPLPPTRYPGLGGTEIETEIMEIPVEGGGGDPTTGPEEGQYQRNIEP